MGKSTLLREFARECRRAEPGINWMYTDWEASGIAAQDGTPQMMCYLASQLRAAYGIEFPHFESAYRKLRYVARGEKEGLIGIDPTHESIERPQVLLSRAFVADLTTLVTSRPLVLLFDTFEVVQGFADIWVRAGLLKSFLVKSQLRNRIVLVVAGRFNEDDRLSYKDDVKTYFGAETALFDRNLDRLSRRDTRVFIDQVQSFD